MPDSSLNTDVSSYAGYGNTNKLLAAASNSPDNLNSWLTAARQGQALTASQYELSQKHLGALNGLAASVLADPTTENATQRISDGLMTGVIMPDDANQELAKINSFGGDPQKITQWAYQHVGTIMNVKELMQQRYGEPGTVDDGQSVNPVVTRTGPQAGVYPAGGNAMRKFMNPGEAAAPTDYTRQDGTVVHTTRRGYGQAVGDTAGLPPVSGAPQPGDVVRNPIGSGGASPSPTIAGAGAGSAPQQAFGAQGRPVPHATVGQPQSGTVPGLPGPAPGYLDAAKVAGTASAEQGVALQKAADGAPVRKAMLANLNDDLDKFTSGPGADWQQVGKAWANRNVLPQSMQFDPQSIASQEAFNKQSTQLAQQQFAALGGTGTDQQLSSSFKANPNQALSKLGNQQIIQLLRGNEDALSAKATAWQDWQQRYGANSYGAFQQDFNKSYNPRVYQAMYMSPDQIGAMRKNMSPAEQQQFARDYVALKAKGYITPGATSGQ